MGRRTVAAVLAAVVALLAAAVAIVRRNSVRMDRAVERRVDALLAGTAADRPTAGADEPAVSTDQQIGADDRDDLPPPVRRYLDTVCPESRPTIETVRIEQRGQFRLGDADSSWKPLEATQYVTTDPPGFLWDASIAVAPLVPTRVVDAYEGGTGSLTATLYSTIPVADAERSAELDRGELMRYLAEAVWYPTALAPGNGVAWEPIHDRAARATIEDGDTAASLTFYFGEDDLVTRVVGERPRLLDDGSYERTRWTGHWDDYEERAGVVVPTSGRVAWNLPSETRTYWRASLASIEYGVAADLPQASAAPA